MKIEDVLEALVKNGFEPYRQQFDKENRKWVMVKSNKPVMTKYVHANFNTTQPGECTLVMCKPGYENVVIGLTEKGAPPRVIAGTKTLMQIQP